MTVYVSCPFANNDILWTPPLAKSMRQLFDTVAAPPPGYFDDC